MTEISIEAAQANLPELISSLGDGEEVLLTRNQKPVAKLVGQKTAAASQTGQPRKPGSAQGSVIFMAEDFDAPLEDFEDYMP